MSYRVRYTFIQIAKKKKTSKNTFIQKHFHPKTLSSKNTFVQNHFIQNRRQFHPRHFHPKTGSSTDTFIQKRVHPMTTFIQKWFRPMTFSSQTIFIQPHTPKHLNPKDLQVKRRRPSADDAFTQTRTILIVSHVMFWMKPLLVENVIR